MTEPVKPPINLTSGIEPGESEFSWGKGIMPSLQQIETAGELRGTSVLGGEPNNYQRLRAERATDNLDPGAEPNWQEYIRE